MTGGKVLSSSATPWETNEKFPFRTAEGEKIAYCDFPPAEMTKRDIENTIGDFVRAASMAMEIGFDGVEINGGNGNCKSRQSHLRLL
jgi:2,4-dienoyl-CoA reductase-like NADH-dependent reductase (Old Yellow Enzyme family)